jgi:diguanylate cyclase (GGDEF)-like protein
MPARLDLANLTLPDLVRCSGAIRELGRAATGFEGAARSIVRHLHRRFGQPAGGSGSCPLVGLYRTPRHRDPAPHGPDAGGTRVEQRCDAGMPCLDLVASAGDAAGWNRTRRSAGHRAGPLPGPHALAELPAMTRLVRQLGTDAAAADLAPELIPNPEQGTSHVFHIAEASGSRHLAGEDDLVLPLGIRSVLGFGDVLPSGEHFAVVLFSRTAVSRQTASLFVILAHSTKLALLPFLDAGRPEEEVSLQGVGERRAPQRQAESPPALRSRVAALQQLLEAHEQTVLALDGASPHPAPGEEPRGRARRDASTQLAHRSQLCQRAADALTIAVRSGHQVSVILLDLDGFRVVNDRLGHRAGDRLLRAVGDRLRRAVRPGDTLAHMGGDEFAVLLPAADTTVAAAVARRVLDELSAPFTVERNRVFVGASLGVAASDGNNTAGTSSAAVDRLIAHADLALYAAKSGGRGRIQVYDRALHQPALQRLALDADLRRVEEREFFLEYQPVVSLADARLDGAEALLRWRHPSRGLVGPADFIAAAEQTGQIVRIGAWVLDTACREAVRWPARGPSGRRPSVSVNVSCRQLHEPGFAERVLETLRTSGLGPSQLVLEVTESVLVEDLETARTQLELVRAQGVRIAVDDFGAGFSSLGYLRALPLDIVKIDRMFVTDLGTSEEDRALILAIVRLLGTVEARIVAEGIETSDQLAYVHALGIDAGQGYYLGRPVASGVFSRLLDQPVVDWHSILDAHGDADAHRQRSAALSLLSDLPVPIRTMVVEANPALRAQLRSLLEGVGDFDVVGEAGHGVEAVEVAGAAHPDVILVDARMPRADGADVVRRMRSRCPGARLVVLSALDATERRAEADRLGADEYITTGTSLSGIVSVLRDVGARGTGTSGRALEEPLRVRRR